MTPLSRAVQALIFGLAIFSAPAHADWEAQFVATSSTKEFPQIVGKFYSKVDRFRLDSPYPFEMSVYARMGSSRVYAAVHSFRIRLSSSLNKFSGQLPGCLSKKFSDCVATLRLRRVGEEECPDGKTPHACEVFEGKPTSKDIQKIKLWHWKGESEPVLARSVVTKADGSEIRTEFSQISRKPRADSHFTIPANYKDAGSIERFFGDLKGKDE